MAAKPRFNPDDFPNSPYAAELRRGVSALRFAPELEEQFVHAHLERLRFRVKVWWLTGLILVPAYTILRAVEIELWSIESAFRAFFIAVLVGMTWLVFSAHFENVYPKLSRLMVPLSGCAAVFLNTYAVVRGNEERLVAVASTLICAFFLSGAQFRTALYSSLLMLATFAVTVLMAGLPTHFVIASLLWLVIVAIVGAAFGWDMEKSYRETFLEAGLISELAARDGLTGLKNRRAFDEHMVRMWQQALRDQRLLTLMMVDVDYFKRYNDAYGHQAGDEALRQIGKIVDGFARRPLDLAARYGGEEFAVVLYDLATEHVIQIAQQLQRAIKDRAIEHRESTVSDVITVSIGIAIVQPALGRSRGGILQLADEALYEAKRQGRDRIHVAQADYDSFVTGAHAAQIRETLDGGVARN